MLKTPSSTPTPPTRRFGEAKGLRSQDVQVASSQRGCTKLALAQGRRAKIPPPPQKPVAAMEEGRNVVTSEGKGGQEGQGRARGAGRAPFSAFSGKAPARPERWLQEPVGSTSRNKSY